MARPIKAVVDYFPHDCDYGKTIPILQQRFGLTGYALWFKLLEQLGKSEYHFIDCRNDDIWLFLTAETMIEEDLLQQILDLCARLGSIDKDLWEQKIIYSEKFVERIKDAYKNRKIGLITKDDLMDYALEGKSIFEVINASKNQKDVVNASTNPAKNQKDVVNVDINPQSKLKETKVNKTKVNKIKENTHTSEGVSLFLKNLEFGVCEISDEEFAKLKALFSNEPITQKDAEARTKDLVEQFDDWLACGNSSANHFASLRSWAKRRIHDSKNENNKAASIANKSKSFESIEKEKLEAQRQHRIQQEKLELKKSLELKPCVISEEELKALPVIGRGGKPT
jgi:hypothetical protein